MLLRSLFGRMLVAGLVGGALVTAAAPAVASAAPAPFTRTVEPWIPGNPPSSPPAVDLTAACVRRVGPGRFEAVFGYDNRGPTSVFAPIEPDSDIVDNNVIRRGARVEDIGPQATLFLPGRTPHAFAVRFRAGERIAWQVRVPSSDEPIIDAGWKVTVRPRLGARCGPRVPTRFAVVQQARAFLAPTDVVRDAAGAITSWGAEIGIFEERIACSTGGVPRPSRVTVGWSVPQPNLQPLPNGSFSLLDTGGGTFEMTAIRTRAAIDIVERVEWLGPIADVYGRCAFGDAVVGSDVFWAGDPATGVITPIVEGGAVVDLRVDAVLPGGVRIR